MDKVAKIARLPVEMRDHTHAARSWKSEAVVE